MTAALAQIEDLHGVGLDDLNHAAALQTRVDRKYLVTPAQLAALLDRVGDEARVLEIDGRRGFRYQSIYFDTPAFDSYLGAAHRRPNRFKVRTRRYLDSHGCWVEVKLRSRHGQTVKHRHEHDVERFDELTPASLAFVASFPRVRDLAHLLEPLITTSYTRSTLLVGAMRATIDVDVTCASARGAVVLGGGIIVETKTEGAASAVDRVLWDLHVRPSRISKFAIGVGATYPELPSNRWHRTMRCHVHPRPGA